MAFKNPDPRIRATRDKIINAYVELLVEKERDFISINDICLRSKINRTTFYRHYLNLSSIEDDIEEMVLAEFKKLLDKTNLEDFLYGRKEFLKAVNEIIVTDIGFYSKILMVNQKIGFLEKINTDIKERLRSTLSTKTALSPAQVELILTFAVAGRIAVYRRWIISNFVPSADVVSETLERISSSGLDSFLIETPKG